MRIVVLQADGRRFAGGVRAPLSVGLARWRGQGEDSAVIAKVTLRWKGAAEPREVVVAEPVPVQAAAVSGYGGAELARPDDFVLGKDACDVLVVGHAFADPPAAEVGAALTIGDRAWSMLARAAEAADAIPLLDAHLDGGEGPAPRAVSREAAGDVWAAFDALQLSAARPAFRRPHLTGADVAAGLEVTMTGLSARGPVVRFSLPPWAPRVFVERGVDDFVEVPLVCDTMLVDTDFERVELTWRALIPEALSRADRWVAALDDVSAPASRDAIARLLPRGDQAFALEEAPADDGDGDELTMAGWEVLEHASDPELSLEAYARISAELAERPDDRAGVLAEHGLDERAWIVEERAWTDSVAHDVSHGDGRLSAQLGALSEAESRARAGADEPRPREAYEAVRARIAAGEPPQEVLREAGLSPGEWVRLERHWLGG